jgi:hypothetical protein
MLSIKRLECSAATFALCRNLHDAWPSGIECRIGVLSSSQNRRLAMNRTALLVAMLCPLTLPAAARTDAIRPHPAMMAHARTTILPTRAISDEQVCMDQFGLSRRDLDVNDREDEAFEPMLDRCIARHHQM